MARFFRTSYGVMAVVIAMYLVKVAAKVGFGTAMGSPMILGDGYHNASDIFQALLVIVGVYLARRPPSKRHPFGLPSMDALGGLLIGLSLGYAAIVGVFVPSAVGLVGFLPWISDVLHVRPATGSVGSQLGVGSNAWFAVALMLVSAGISVVVGRYQVRVGTETSHASVVADGQETLSDGKIEALAGVGVILQMALGLPWLEYVLGFGMTYIMLGTAWEILPNAFAVLFNRSLEESAEDSVRAEALNVRGVERVASLITYRRGTCAVVQLDVETRLGASGGERVRRAIARAVTERLKETETGEVSVSVHCVQPPVRESRWAFLMRREGDDFRLIASPGLATHLMVGDVTDGALRGGRYEAVTRDTLAGLLREKKVDVLCVYLPPNRDVADVAAAIPNTVRIYQAPTSVPTLLGIPLV